MYHAAMGAMQGQGPQEIYDRICALLMDMQKAQWVSIHQNYDRYHNDSNSRTNYKKEFISPSSPFTSFFSSGLLDPCPIDQFQLCTRAASAECCTLDKRGLDGPSFHVVSSD